jgi:hypothetical protein
VAEAEAVMYAAVGSRLADFLPSLAIGILVGLLLARGFWSWVAWREWRDASDESDRRTARLSDELLERMERDLARESGPTETPVDDPWPPPRRS